MSPSPTVQTLSLSLLKLLTMITAIHNLNKIKPNNRIDTSNSTDYNVLDQLPPRWTRQDSHELPKPKNLAKIEYYAKVWEITEKNAPNVENIHLRGQDYHLDHRIPISYGFKNNLHPIIIGQLKNLRIITRKHNLTKNRQYPFHE